MRKILSKIQSLEQRLAAGGHKKIDFFFDGTYLFSSNSYPTVKDGIEKILKQCADKAQSHQYKSVSLSHHKHIVPGDVLANPKGLKGNYDKQASSHSDFIKWLDLFIKEKGIDLEQGFTVEGPSGTNHMTYGIVIEHMKIAPQNEQKQIKDALVKLDFKNSKIEPFLKHLAQAIAR